MKKGLCIVISAGILILSGCSSSNVVVSPDLVLKKHDKKLLYGNVKYSKFNREYLPQSISHEKTSSTILNYDYSVVYNNGNVDMDGLNLFNPLSLFGFPFSETGILVSGKLQVIKKGKIVEQFEAHCASKKTRNLFDTGATSEDRKKCLLKIRDSIDSQIFNTYNKEKK